MNNDALKEAIKETGRLLSKNPETLGLRYILDVLAQVQSEQVCETCKGKKEMSPELPCPGCSGDGTLASYLRKQIECLQAVISKKDEQIEFLESRRQVICDNADKMINSEREEFNKQITSLQADIEKLKRALGEMVSWYGGMADGVAEEGARQAVEQAKVTLAAVWFGQPVEREGGINGRH